MTKRKTQTKDVSTEDVELAASADDAAEVAIPDDAEDETSNEATDEAVPADEHVEAETPTSDDAVFALHDRPGPDETQALIEHLRDAPSDAPLVLDAAAVEATGTPYILALAAAARARADAGAPAVLANPSSAVVDAFSDLGLFQDLMKMEFRP